jgi:uncharacterized protein with FMN-binding domain
MIFKTVLRYSLIILFVFGYVTASAQLNSQPDKNLTKNQTDDVIKQAGSINPDWWDSVELNIPVALDMNWPVQQGIWEGRGGTGERGERGQMARRGPQGQRGERGLRSGQIPTNVDQYLMQVIYPNPSLHKQGIKLVYQLMTMHKDNIEKYKRDINTLGYLFNDLLMDYGRAAYWWQKYAETGESADMLKIARCYYELESKSAALEILEQASKSPNNNNRDIIKLWATIGEVDKALEMIESNTGTTSGGGGPDRGNNVLVENNMLAAEICRQAGRFDQAITYYQKVADAQPVNQNNQARGGRGGDRRNFQMQANANMEAVKLIKILDLSRVPDGSYTGTSTGHEGNFSVKVTISNGKITSVEVTQQRETPNRYAMAEQVTRKIVEKQGFQGVDAISGATETSDAIINAVAKAIVGAIK